MYGWLWRRLPGGPGARLFQVALLLLVVGLVLWYVVYPWASLHLPSGQPGPG